MRVVEFLFRIKYFLYFIWATKHVISSNNDNKQNRLIKCIILRVLSIENDYKTSIILRDSVSTLLFVHYIWLVIKFYVMFKTLPLLSTFLSLTLLSFEGKVIIDEGHYFWKEVFYATFAKSSEALQWNSIIQYRALLVSKHRKPLLCH